MAGDGDLSLGPAPPEPRDGEEQGEWLGTGLRGGGAAGARGRGSPRGPRCARRRRCAPARACGPRGRRSGDLRRTPAAPGSRRGVRDAGAQGSRRGAAGAGGAGRAEDPRAGPR